MPQHLASTNRDRSEFDQLPSEDRAWQRERRTLVAAAMVLLIIVLTTAVASFFWFENEGTRFYKDSIHALVMLSAEQLQDTFKQAEKIVSVLARSSAAQSLSEESLLNLLDNTFASLRDAGAIAVLLLHGPRVLSVPAEASTFEMQRVVADARQRCPNTQGSLCIAHVLGLGGRHLILVSGRDRQDLDGDPTYYVVVIEWKTLASRIIGQTFLDQWSKTFVLDRDGTLLAWPDSAKKPGFKVVDSEAGCAQCHDDIEREPTLQPAKWSATTLKIQNKPYIVVTAPAKVGQGTMYVGIVSPRQAAFERLRPVVLGGGGVLLTLICVVIFVMLMLHKLGSAQVRAVRSANRLILSLNEELEVKVEERTAELQEALIRARQLQKEHSTLDRWAAVGELAAVFAHEVRTPLNALSIAGQRLKRLVQKEGSVPVETALEILQSQARDVEVINAYVENYLNFTRRTRADLQSAPEPHQLRRLVEEVFSYVLIEADRNKVKLNADIDSAQTRTLDGGKLRHVLVNLVLNAIQAQPGGGEVEVSVKFSPGEVLLAVADRGPGIPPEHSSSVFEPFRSYREGGTGLGLAICQRLAVEAGANIMHEPRPGGGTVFVVHWPTPRQEGAKES